MNNQSATFSIKAITGIDCFRVSLVTVQLACFTRIKTDECGITQPCDVRRIISGTFNGPALFYRCHWGLSCFEREPPAHGVRVGVVDLGILDNAFSLFPSHPGVARWFFNSSMHQHALKGLLKKGPGCHPQGF